MTHPHTRISRGGPCESQHHRLHRHRLGRGRRARQGRIRRRPAPTKEQLDQAKKAFGEGKALFDEGKLPEAIDKFKESYRLSQEPAAALQHRLHARPGRAEGQGAASTTASSSPTRRRRRRSARKSQKRVEGDREGEARGRSRRHDDHARRRPTGADDRDDDDEARRGREAPVKIKPAGTYTRDRLPAPDRRRGAAGQAARRHRVRSRGLGLDGRRCTTAAPATRSSSRSTMKWRYKELVARIPGDEDRRQHDPVLHRGQGLGRRGRRALGQVDEPEPRQRRRRRAPRVLPRLHRRRRAGRADRRADASTTNEEDPLGNGQEARSSTTSRTVDGGRQRSWRTTETPTPGGNGFSDVGSSKFEYAKWVSTGIAGRDGRRSPSLFVHPRHSKQASPRSTRLARLRRCGAPPCRTFDTLRQGRPGRRQALQTRSTRSTLVVGVGAGVRRRLLLVPRAHARRSTASSRCSKSGGSPETTWARSRRRSTRWLHRGGRSRALLRVTTCVASPSLLLLGLFARLLAVHPDLGAAPFLCGDDRAALPRRLHVPDDGHRRSEVCLAPSGVIPDAGQRQLRRRQHARAERHRSTTAFQRRSRRTKNSLMFAGLRDLPGRRQGQLLDHHHARESEPRDDHRVRRRERGMPLQGAILNADGTPIANARAMTGEQRHASRVRAEPADRATTTSRSQRHRPNRRRRT